MREPPPRVPRPEAFEATLARDPDDRPAREAALAWYHLWGRDPDKLRAHTRECLRRHPDTLAIYRANFGLFDRSEAYRAEVQAALEAARDDGRREPLLLLALAKVAAHRVIPPRFGTATDRRRWLQYFGLPLDHPIPERVDEARAATAAQYLRDAVAATRGAGMAAYAAIAARALVETLTGLDRRRDALDAALEQLREPERPAAPDLHVTCAGLFIALRQYREARHAYEAAIDEDTRGCERGGHATAHAHLGLGELALARGEHEVAVEHLLAAASVRPCCHTSTQGLPLRLARRLLDAGERGAVARFCQTIVTSVCRGDGPAQALLEQARQREGDGARHDRDTRAATPARSRLA